MATDDSPTRAGDVYGPFLAHQLSVEAAHKTSIEQRGLAVITTSGVLISFLVALSALALGRDSDAFLNAWTRGLIAAAVVAFVAAAGCGILANAPRRYHGLGPDDLDRLVSKPLWNAGMEEAAFLVGAQRVEELRASMKANDQKARALMWAIGSEVAGVTLVAAAIVAALLG